MKHRLPRHVMRPGWYLFCRIVARLDHFPRYGRYYTLKLALEELERDQSRRLSRYEHVKHWAWQKHGRWGSNLLTRLGLFWDFLEEDEIRWHYKELKDPRLKNPAVQRRRYQRERWATIVVSLLALSCVVCLVLSAVIS